MMNQVGLHPTMPRGRCVCLVTLRLLHQWLSDQMHVASFEGNIWELFANNVLTYCLRDHISTFQDCGGTMKKLCVNREKDKFIFHH